MGYMPQKTNKRPHRHFFIRIFRKTHCTNGTRLLIRCDILMSVCLSAMQLVCTVTGNAARLPRTGKRWRRPPLNSQWPLKPGLNPERKEQLYVLLTAHLDIMVKRRTNLMHNLFLVHFVNLNVFRAYLRPSSGVTTVCTQQLVLIILLTW
jgi:hypothetical protein